MKRNPGYQIMFRCDPHMVDHFSSTIPTWCIKLNVHADIISCKKIRNEVEIVMETRWDISQTALQVLKQRLDATRMIRNVRIVAPDKPK